MYVHTQKQTKNTYINTHCYIHIKTPSACCVAVAEELAEALGSCAGAGGAFLSWDAMLRELTFRTGGPEEEIQRPEELPFWVVVKIMVPFWVP